MSDGTSSPNLKGQHPQPERDWSNPRYAQILAERIETYWRERGVKVSLGVGCTVRQLPSNKSCVYGIVESNILDVVQR